MATLIANPLIAPPLPTEISYASPRTQPQATSIFAPSPPSVRSRRSGGSSSDQTPVPAADGFLESDLRAGGPQLCESPCETIYKLPPGLKNYHLLTGPESYQLLVQLGDICRQDSLSHSRIIFCGRRSMYEPTRDPIVTLLVVASRGDSAQPSWITLSRKLFHYLHDRGLKGVSVEIVDPKSEQRPMIHGCLPNDSIFPIWRQVAMAIFNHIDQTGVFTIGCFRIGNSNERLRCAPTILLGVDRNVKRDWKQVREAVVGVLDAHGLNTVAVIIRKDNQVTRGGSLDSGDKGATPEDCRHDPKLGTSICPGGMKDGQGTLGGWVEVKNPKSGDWIPFALTSSHCCFPADDGLSAADLEVIQKWKRHGVRPNDADSARLLPVDSPSYRDIKRGLDNLAHRIGKEESEKVYREVEELKANDEFVMPLLERRWKVTVTAIAQLQGERHIIKQFFHESTHRLGSVFAASGFREVQSTDDPNKLSVRDWALIPPTRDPAGLTQLAGFDTALPTIDQDLFKIGRATGYTEAKYGNLCTCKITTRIVNGKEVHIPTWEHVMLWLGQLAIQDGDSGSLVFSHDGADVGYFTATRDLLADIKHITGVKEVRLRYHAN
ncbi:hypothetical protein BJX70DRAFT_386274 [Aspergillus crustosus]